MTPTSTCPLSENESECGNNTVGSKEELEDGEEQKVKTEDAMEESESQHEAGDSPKSSMMVEENPANLTDLVVAPEPENLTKLETPTAVTSEIPDVQDDSEPSETQQASIDTASSQQPPETETTISDAVCADSSASDPDTNTSKDLSPSSSSSPLEDKAAAAPAEGFIQGLLDILPNGEPTAVAVD